MTKEYRAKTFKSGNSIALRLPKALGLREGEEMVLREEGGKFELEPAPTERRKVNVDAFWGTIPGLRLLRPEEREFEERELDWEGKRLKQDD